MIQLKKEIEGSFIMKKWNLDALYTSFDSKEFQDSLVTIEKLIKESTEKALKEFNDPSEPVRKINRSS